MNPEPLNVDVFVDPICPFAWITSRWLVDVEQQGAISLRFRVMSLSVLNEGRDDIPQFYRDLVDRAWGPARVLIATGDRHGSGAVRRLYEALGTRLHVRQEDVSHELLVDALGAADLPADLADVADIVDNGDDLLRRSHHAGMDAVGEEVGTPVIHIHEPGRSAPTAFFGPVLSKRPTGEGTLRLWEAVRVAAATPEFFELKRSRNVALAFD